LGVTGSRPALLYAKRFVPLPRLEAQHHQFIRRSVLPRLENQFVDAVAVDVDMIDQALELDRLGIPADGMAVGGRVRPVGLLVGEGEEV
jgi:hypothetical protein